MKIILGIVKGVRAVVGFFIATFGLGIVYLGAIVGGKPVARILRKATVQAVVDSALRQELKKL